MTDKFIHFGTNVLTSIKDIHRSWRRGAFDGFRRRPLWRLVWWMPQRRLCHKPITVMACSIWIDRKWKTLANLPRFAFSKWTDLEGRVSKRKRSCLWKVVLARVCRCSPVCKLVILIPYWDRLLFCINPLRHLSLSCPSTNHGLDDVWLLFVALVRQRLTRENNRHELLVLTDKDALLCMQVIWWLNVSMNHPWHCFLNRLMRSGFRLRTHSTVIRM